jgi:hypothetical protein
VESWCRGATGEVLRRRGGVGAWSDVQEVGGEPVRRAGPMERRSTRGSLGTGGGARELGRPDVGARGPEERAAAHVAGGEQEVEAPASARERGTPTAG